MDLDKIFASNMVYPAHKPIVFYGKGDGEVTVTFNNKTETVYSENGKWMATFPEMPYGGPYNATITFDDKNVEIDNIYVGEVYMFSGQSNNQFKLQASNTPHSEYKNLDLLRLFTSDRLEAGEYYSTDDGWVAAKLSDVGKWSALGYLVGKEIVERKNIAVGIIACYQGASVIESWLPEGSQKKLGINLSLDEKNSDHRAKAYSVWNEKEGTLYEKQLSQIIPFPLSGIVWYQGESDASEAEGKVYAKELCELINVLRKDFNDEKLPFVIVQLADFEHNDHFKGWELIQQAQLDVETMLKNVKTVISSDVCEKDDIHPPSKLELAKRIASTL